MDYGLLHVLLQVNNFQKVIFAQIFIKKFDRFFSTAVKFSFSEKATKICTIYLVNVKTIRRMAQIFVAFSEKLNFNVQIFWEGHKNLKTLLNF